MGRGMLIGACHALRQIASTGSIETITPPCVWQAYRNLIFRRQEEEDSTISVDGPAAKSLTEV
jgi:hypothetical protein